MRQVQRVRLPIKEMEEMNKKQKLCLLLIFLCLFGFIEYTAKGERTYKEARFYTILSGDIGAGLGTYGNFSNEYDDYDSDSNWSDWPDNTVYGFTGSIRFCRLTSTILGKKNPERGMGGFGIEISGHRLNHKAEEELFLSYEFQSTSIIATPGYQMIGLESGLGMFIGLIGFGYVYDYQFTKGFWYHWSETFLEEMLSEEGKKVDIDIETKISPVVLTILPVKVDLLLHRNIAIGLDFSGLICHRGTSKITPEEALEGTWLAFWMDPEFSSSFWIANFRIGLTLSLYLY